MSNKTDPIEPNDPNVVRGGKIFEPKPAPMPDKSSFETFKENATSAKNVSTPGNISPMELSQKSILSQTPTYQTILEQTQNASDTLAKLNNQLNTPNLKLKKTHQELLDTKLTSANGKFDETNNILGAKESKESTNISATNPAVRFLGYVSDGQNKLIQAQNILRDISNSNKELKPADMILIQVKLAQAQQEIEYSSVLLSKVIDSLKQMLNIQL